jgi:hypothetical protein
VTAAQRAVLRGEVLMHAVTIARFFERVSAKSAPAQTLE